VSLYADRPTLCIKDISVGCCYLSKQSFYRTLSFDKISVKKPDPPEPPPAYITDGVSKQDTESLLGVTELDRSINQYRDNPSDDEISVDVDHDGKIERINNSGDTITAIKNVPYGTDVCSNCPHDPYRYEVHQESGSWFELS
jgi:hypothetical protein